MEFVGGTPALQVLLVAVIFLSVLMEVKTGGMGFGVLLGLIAAGVFFSSQYVKGLVSLYEVAVFLVGILLIVAEALLPATGVLGALGVAAMLYSVVLALGGDVNAVYALFAAFALALFLFALIARFLPESRLWKRVVLHDASTSAKGYVSAEERTDLIGREALVLTDVRPAGSILVDGVPVDVVSEGAYIEKGESVCVTEVHGSRIVVLIGMRMRRVPPGKIVMPLIKANKAGLDVQVNQLEAHYLAGGNVDKVVDAVIPAHRAQIPLPFERSAAIDLAGRDVLDAVQMSVNPKVIETPIVSAVAMNGIELKIKARVTVRANIDRLVGGAGEPTIIARVGEGIVTTVGSSASHGEVLANPDVISKTVLGKGLDAGTAFEILSIDIADVDVGRNIGAELQTDQAEADKRIAQAKAEERRAMAVAKEQEMKAYTQEMEAKVVEAQAEVPHAMAEALKSGNLGVMDYYNLRNVQADTDMRTAISEAGANPPHTAK